MRELRRKGSEEAGLLEVEILQAELTAAKAEVPRLQAELTAVKSKALAKIRTLARAADAQEPAAQGHLCGAAPYDD